MVASDRGAIGEPVIEGENGHIVAVDTPMSLADRLIRMDAAPHLYKRPPKTQPLLRGTQDQTDELVAVYTRLRR